MLQQIVITDSLLQICYFSTPQLRKCYTVLRCFLTFRWGLFHISLSYVLFEFLTFPWQVCNASLSYIIFYSDTAMQTWIYQDILLVKRQLMTTDFFFFFLDLGRASWKIWANSVVGWSLQKHLHLFVMLQITGKVRRLNWVRAKLEEGSLAHCWSFCKFSQLTLQRSRWWVLHTLFH